MNRPNLSFRPTEFLSDRRGAVLPFVALMVIPILGAVGLAIDAARAYMVKEKLSYALDAAALAAAKSVGTDNLQEDFEKYFNSNFPEDYMGAEISGPNIAVSGDQTTVSVDASASIDTSFMRVVGFDDLSVSAEAEVTRGSNPVDLVLAIDMSGSMGSSSGSGGTRIAAARQAATDLVDMLFGDDETKEHLNIGLVPWNHEVNVTENGTLFSSTTTSPLPNFVNPISGEVQSEVYYPNNSPVPLLFDPQSSWTGCVYARYLDDANSGNDADVEFGAGTYGTAAWMGWEPTNTYDPSASSGGSSSSKKKKKKKKKKSGSSSGLIDDSSCLEAGITPLQQSKSSIQDAIDELTDPDGATNIAQGLVWAWRVLRSDAPFEEAEADPDPVPSRVIVLLTDGQHWGWEEDAYKGVFGSGTSAQSELDDRLREIAENVKADGVKIIAIQFAYSGTSLEDLLKEVASDDESPYYYYAPDGDALQDVFEEVGSVLTSLHISK